LNEDVNNQNRKEEMKVDKNDDDNDNNNNQQFLKGQTYILVDAGGGTCDVACHEIVEEFKVKEIIPPSGGAWGSTYIDDEFIRLLKTIFTDNWIEEFKQSDPSSYCELMENFRKAKQTFFKENMQKQSHNVELPLDFLTFLENKIANENNDKTLVSMVEQTQFLNKAGLITVMDEVLIVDSVIWKQLLFDVVVNPTIAHVKKLLDDDKLMKGRCNFMCLVGGLSESLYFQSRMREVFGEKSFYKLPIIVPKRPILSVVDGAARFGAIRNYIVERKLKKTYGISTMVSVAEAKRLKVPQLHMNAHTSYYASINDDQVTDIFSTFVKRGDCVRMDAAPIKQSYCRLHRNQRTATISIYATDSLEPIIIDDTCRNVGNIVIDFPAYSDDLGCYVEFDFSDTTVRVFAYPKSKPNNRKEIVFQYKF